MVSIFEHVRDIPFWIPSDPGMYDPATTPDLILQRGCGSCAAKHFLLSGMYRKLNVNVVFATFAFLWNDPGLHYPPDLRALAARIPVAYHLACRVPLGARGRDVGSPAAARRVPGQPALGRFIGDAVRCQAAQSAGADRVLPHPQQRAVP
jgi:hypothetical protein